MYGELDSDLVFTNAYKLLSDLYEIVESNLPIEE